MSSRTRITEASTLGHSPVFRGCNLIGSGIGKLPCVVYRRLDDGGKERDTRHPAYPLLRRRANRLVNIMLFFARLTIDAIIHGSGFARIHLDRRLAPVSLEILDPRRVKAPKTAAGETYAVTRADGGKTEIFYDEMIHIRMLTRDGIEGYGLLQLARESLGLGLAARKYGASYFENAISPSVAIHVPIKLTDEHRGKLKNEWDAAHRGPDNAHKACIIDAAGDIKPLALNPQETQLLALRQFDVNEVANWLCLPAYMLGSEKTTSHSSLESESQSLLDHTFDPWLRQWEFELEEKLLTPAQRAADSHSIVFMRQALVRANMEARGKFYESLGRMKAITPNEVRAREDMNPVEWGDEPVEPPGQTGVNAGGDAGKASKALAADALRRYRLREASLAAKGKKPGAELRKALLEPALAILGADHGA